MAGGIVAHVSSALSTSAMSEFESVTEKITEDNKTVKQKVVGSEQSKP